jgi:oxalate decarboxylase/phosphoglucose isomerase-like protein (cupin superfamily)
VHAGDIIFVPRNTWIGAENVGPEHLTLASVYSAPGYEEYLRSVSVLAGQPVTPLSQEEIEEIRKRHMHDGVYQNPPK